MKEMMTEHDALSRYRSRGSGPSSSLETPPWYATFSEYLKHFRCP
jgi:hypothetical protein